LDLKRLTAQKLPGVYAVLSTSRTPIRMIADGQPLTVVARSKISQTEMGQMEVGVYDNSFVVEEADDSTILVRHILAGVRFLFGIKGRTLDG